ncbi:MAG TPA: hypothetical protein VGA13_02740 [Acidimicrobiales bacterium]|jgi:hypothetical protein
MAQSRSRSKILGAFLAVGALAASIGIQPATADTATQVVQGSLLGTVTISTDPTATADFGSFSIGVNQVSGGQIAVDANVAYTLKVDALKDNMTKYTASTYDDGTTLATQALLLTALDSGTATPVASVTVSTTEVTIATGLGLTTDTFDLTHSQTVLIGDEPTTYRNDLTYTAASVI